MTDRRKKRFWKSYPDIEQSPIWNDLMMVKLWNMCLNRARWQVAPVVLDIKGYDVKVQMGQFTTTMVGIHTEFTTRHDGRRNTNADHCVTPRTLWRKLFKMQGYGFLSLEMSHTHTLVEVVNWRPWQHSDDCDCKHCHAFRHASVTALSKVCHGSVTGLSNPLRLNSLEVVEDVELKETAASLGNTENREPAAATVNGAGAADFSEDENSTATEDDMDSKQQQLPGTEDIRFTTEVEQAGLELFSPLPGNWRHWLNTMRMAGHTDDDIIRALHEARKTSHETGNTIRTLNYVTECLGTHNAQGEPKQVKVVPETVYHTVAPLTGEQERLRDVRQGAGVIIGEWEALARERDLWVPLWEGPRKGMTAIMARMAASADCATAPSGDDLWEAWCMFRDAEHTNPVRWSEFAETMRSQLGWTPIKPQKEG